MVMPLFRPFWRFKDMELFNRIFRISPVHRKISTKTTGQVFSVNTNVLFLSFFLFAKA